MNSDQRHDFAFYEAGESARRLSWLVLPLRRLLRRLLGPVWSRERELFEALSRDIGQAERLAAEGDDELRRRLEEIAASAAYLSERIDALERQVQATAGLGWDHVALVQRLATLEDRLGVATEPDQAFQRHG